MKCPICGDNVKWMGYRQENDGPWVMKCPDCWRDEDNLEIVKYEMS